MHRILFILLLVPIFAVRAATPFVSVAVQPTLTMVGDNWSLLHEGGSFLDNYFYTYGGGAAAGLRAGRKELYVEYTWKNSHEEHYGWWTSATVYDSLVLFSSRHISNRYKDKRAKLGFRYIISRNSKETIVSTVGCGLSAGTTQNDEREHVDYEQYIQTDSTTITLWESSTSYSFTDNYSLRSLGWFVEMGSRFLFYKNLSAVVTGQLHSFIADYRFGIWDGPGTVSNYYIEPSLSVALRWDFGKRRAG